ncbi:MAG: orotate phosphoribosyltransferase [Bacteroidales bacterium]|nr:orotate phosphoribosyltransferase [Bacteroidales bacterium]
MLFSEEFSAKIAEILLQKKAILLSVDSFFTWASGWKSPIYCDNRRLLSYPDAREVILEGMIKILDTYFKEAQVIAGVATAGIPWASMVADRMKLPLVYVRSNPKDHGLQHQIEGDLKAESKVVIVEDLVSTGKSSLQVLDILRANHVEVLGMMANFSYAFPSTEESFEKMRCKLVTLSDYPSLLKKAIISGYIHEDMLQTLEAWRIAPDKWNAQ